ncbi:Intermembrane phospholipid transport system binding protein MlaD [Gammaproteobacteria bacterium]|nr:outer membrane lipid asymmetry maintenance protein MlaD [Gammaproteobacteria bacterium]QOJ31750.1 MAG: outer membrane lipid asymmetry maintenance protein MlaD [Gammaproteobacteria bacterium]CAG0941961.1 Intermembrane phospholipid transport system binding protein MlaD [Gammaproteobacteria bacterium]
MESTPARELGAGMFILLGFASLFFLATQTTNVESYVSEKGYTVTARFEDVAGLKERAPVTMSGVTIGRVERISFDPKALNAVVTMRIAPEFDEIPDDSDAAILTAGLLGSKYVGIGPGGSETYLKNNSQIQLTQSAIVLENIIGKLLFKLGMENESSKPSE